MTSQSIDNKTAVQDVLDLTINGKIYKVDSTIPPTTTLLKYLREHVFLTGTKGLCYEGGCGACTVVATFRDPENEKEKTCSIKSCQTLVYSCVGWNIETIEHLGDRYRGYHSLQKALVGFYGTQCGYCSPGFIMTMYGELKSSGQLTKEQIEKSLDGNICRCTGYRPILDAFKSLAIDAPKELLHKLHDIEESYKQICPNTGEFCKGKCSKASSDNEGCQKPASQLKTVKTSLYNNIITEGIAWNRPLTLNELYKILQSSSISDSLRFVVGNTAEGVYKITDPYDIYLDITGIPDLYSVAIGNPLVIGANVSLQRCIKIFQHMAKTYTGYEYLAEIASHWENVANIGVRNVGSWAGNLVIKHQHKEFPSDIFITLAVVSAVITLGHSADSSTTEVHVEQLMDLDLSKSVILSVKFPALDANTVIRTYKISQRAVNSHAYVNAGFRFDLDSQDGFRVVSKPTIVYGGINPSFVHAKKTEEFLNSRRLSVEEIVHTAITNLGNEVVPAKSPLDASPAYRKSLAQALLYKTILSIVNQDVSPKFRSGGSLLQRPLSTGQQLFDENRDTWPVGQAIPKAEANIQVSGEAEYVDDMDPVPGELYGGFVQTTVAKAKLGLVDPSEALKIPGVISFVEAKDIPGRNSFQIYGTPDPVFVSGDVQYAGQPIGLVVATSKETARKAAQLVKVTYIEVQKPILALKDVVKETNETLVPETKESTDHTVEGSLETGSQFHFMIEPLSARVIPVEDGYNVFCTTQWPDAVQGAISETLGINNNSINITVRRLGGGFGGKISRPNLVACAAAIASHKLQKPVRITLDLNTHMTLVGWRDRYLTQYKATFDNKGLFKSVDIKLNCDAGANLNEASSGYIYDKMTSVYYSPKWGLNPTAVSTDTAPATPCRTPGTPNAIASIENIIERVAVYLKKDPSKIREINFLDKSVHTSQTLGPMGENLVKTKIFPMLKTQVKYDARRADIQIFNEKNRWKKRGISMVPLFYGLGYPKSFRYNTQVVIYANDGTVVLSHGGIEMGQGLNTKAMQVAAKFLDVPLNYIKVKPTNNVTGANSIITGGSFGSDLVAHGIQKCCELLRKRMNVIEKIMEETNKKKPTWLELVLECQHQDVDLCERFWTASDTHPGGYDIFAAACMEVEIDVLTGQYLCLRTDIIEDCGRSLSPYIDIGQIEGAFIMGLGLFTTEMVTYDTESGQKLTTGTWTYKPLTALDIPTDLRITLLPKGDNKFGVLRSKATGEPALCLGYCVVTALRNAITSARADAGHADWFEMNTPITVEKVQQLCMTDPNSFDLTAKEQEFHDFHIIDKAEVPEVKGETCKLT